MSLQQAGAGIHSLITLRNAGFFARYRPLPSLFSGISGGVPAIGHVRAAAKYRAGGDQGPAWRDVIAGSRRECALTSLSIC